MMNEIEWLEWQLERWLDELSHASTIDTDNARQSAHCYAMIIAQIRKRLRELKAFKRFKKAVEKDPDAVMREMFTGDSIKQELDKDYAKTSKEVIDSD